MSRPPKSPPIFGCSVARKRLVFEAQQLIMIEEQWGIHVDQDKQERLETIATSYVAAIRSTTTQAELKVVAKKFTHCAAILDDLLNSDAGHAAISIADEFQGNQYLFPVNIEMLKKIEPRLKEAILHRHILFDPIAELAFHLAILHRSSTNKLPPRSIDRTEESSTRKRGTASFSGLVLGFVKALQQFGVPYTASTMAKKIENEMPQVLKRMAEDDAYHAARRVAEAGRRPKE